MNFSPNILTAVIAATGVAGHPGELSEAELIARYPALAMAASVVLALGLICDAYLLYRFLSARNRGAGSRAFCLNIQPKPWSVRDLALFAGAGILLLLLGNGYVFLGAKFARLDEDQTFSAAITAELFLRLVMLAGLLLFFRNRRLDWREAFGLRQSSRLKSLTQGVIFYLAVLPPLTAISIVNLPLCKLLRIKPSPQPVADLFLTSDSVWLLVVLVGFAVVVAPLFEETVFRGLAYPTLKQRWGTRSAMLGVSALFALMHMHAPSFAPLLALGLGLALAYEWTGSLLTPIIMHALFNFGSVIVLFYTRTHA